MRPSTLRSPRLSSLATMALLAVAAQSGAQKMVRVLDAGFKIKSRSQWQNGSAANGALTFSGFNYNGGGKFGKIASLDIPATDMGPFGTIPAFSLGETGVEFDGSADFKFGIEGSSGATGGNLSADYSANLTYSYPLYVTPNATVPVTITYRTTPNAHFDTTSPDYTAGVSLVTNLSASLGGRGKFLGLNVFDNPNILGERYGLKNKQQVIFGGTHKIFDITMLSQSNVDNVLSQVQPVGMVFSKPDTTAHGIFNNGGLTLTGTKYSPLISFDTTLIGLLALAAGKAGDVIDLTSKDFKLTAGDANLALSWKIAAFTAQQSYGFLQTVKLKDTPTITFSAGGRTYTHTFTRDNESFTCDFKMPANGALDVQTQVDHQATLDNDIKTATSGAFGFTPFSMEFKGSLGSGANMQSYDFSGKVDEQTFASGISPLERVANEPFEIPDSDLVAPNVSNFTIVPVDDRYPSPVANWSTNSSTRDDDVPYVQPPAYNDYPGNMAGIYSYTGYDLTLVTQTIQVDGQPRITTFSGIDKPDLDRMQVTVNSWDGTLLKDLPNNLEPQFSVYQKGPTSINMKVPAALLRPGRHMMSVTVNAFFQGVAKELKYDVPVIVRVPTPRFDTQAWNRIGTGTDGGFVINRFQYDTKAGRFWFRASRMMLETEVVLDDSVVLPSRKYVQLGGGGGANFVEANATQTFSDEDQIRQYTNATTLVEFDLPADVIKKMNGNVHTLRLRTKDVQGTALDANPVANSDTYAFSEMPGSNPSIMDTRIYFWGVPPTITQITKPDGATRLLENAYETRLAVRGTGFTPVMTASFQPRSYPSSMNLPVEFIDDENLIVTLNGPALDILSQNIHQGTLTLSTPRMDIPNPNPDTPIRAGGSVTSEISTTPLTPSITGVSPLPIRGQKVTLNVTGDGFAAGNQLTATQVLLDGNVLSDFSIHFPSPGRGLKSFSVDVPASLLAQAGTKRLRVVNRGLPNDDQAGSFDITVSNAKPIIEKNGLFVVATDSGASLLNLPGGLFYSKDTTALASGQSVKSKFVDANTMQLEIPASLLKAASVNVSVVNAAPGGGQSNESKVTVFEGDPKSVKVVPGPLVFDRASNSYKQSFAVTYTGARDVSRGARLMFLNLGAGVALANPSGTVGGVPYLSTSLTPRRQVTVVATFRKAGAAPVTASPTVAFPY